MGLYLPLFTYTFIWFIGQRNPQYLLALTKDFKGYWNRYRLCKNPDCNKRIKRKVNIRQRDSIEYCSKRCQVQMAMAIERKKTRLLRSVLIPTKRKRCAYHTDKFYQRARKETIGI